MAVYDEGDGEGDDDGDDHEPGLQIIMWTIPRGRVGVIGTFHLIYKLMDWSGCWESPESISQKDYQKDCRNEYHLCTRHVFVAGSPGCQRGWSRTCGR